MPSALTGCQRRQGGAPRELACRPLYPVHGEGRQQAAWTSESGSRPPFLRLGAKAEIISGFFDD